jgi:VanZ family protein
MRVKLIEKILLYWLPVFLWAGIIFVFSANPTTATSEIHWQDFIIKKTLHIIFFGTLCVFLYRALKESGINQLKAGYTSILFTAFYGITDEVHQSFTPGRMARVYDVIFDTIGAILAVYVIWKYLPKAPKKLKHLAKRFSLI